MKKIISKRKNRWHLDFVETIKTKKTKIPFFAPKEPFRAKKFLLLILLLY